MVDWMLDGGALCLLRASLAPGGVVFAESGALVAMEGALSLEAAPEGNWLGSWVRSRATGRSWMLQRVRALEAPGSVWFGSSETGEIHLLNAARGWCVADRRYLAHEATVRLRLRSVTLDQAWLARDGYAVLDVSGRGRVAVAAPGELHVLECGNGGLVCDPSHVVAWEAALQVDVQMGACRKGWIAGLVATAWSGESWLFKFNGTGRVLVGSRGR